MRRQFYIPGYAEAVESERSAREEIYLDTPHFISGVALKQITPRLLARLFRMETPFLGACELEPEIHVPQFLWALHVSYSRDPRVRRDFMRLLQWRVAQSDFDFDEAAELIDDFLELTFLDAPTGKDETPYACSIAWLEFRMAGDPFRWDTERTLNAPLRRIYQLIRCQMQDAGTTPQNKLSDNVRGDWLALFNKAIKSLDHDEQQRVCDKLNRMDRMSAEERAEFLAQINSFNN